MALLEKWSPFRDLELLDRRLSSLFPPIALRGGIPAADVYERDSELVVELEVPGYEEKELSVEVGDHTLTVSGERAAETERSNKALRLHERMDTSFERRFELPAEIDAEHLTASYAKGVLTLHVPRKHVETVKVPIALA